MRLSRCCASSFSGSDTKCCQSYWVSIQSKGNRWVVRRNKDKNCTFLLRKILTVLNTLSVRKVKIHHVYANREIFYAYCGNTAVDLDPSPVSRARLTVVEPALSETCLKWQRRSKVPPNARCFPSYDSSGIRVYWTTHRTVRTSRPAISTCFFT
jgi:hypothetical protein